MWSEPRQLTNEARAELKLVLAMPCKEEKGESQQVIWISFRRLSAPLLTTMAVKMAVKLAVMSPALSQVLSPDEEKDVSTDAKDAISSSKVATLDEKVASSEPKVVTSEEKVASPKKKISSEEMAIYILEYCSTWRSMDEIAQFANRDKNYIRNKVLPRLAEKLEKEYPDVPNHPRQRYRTIGRS